MFGKMKTAARKGTTSEAHALIRFSTVPVIRAAEHALLAEPSTHHQMHSHPLAC